MANIISAQSGLASDPSTWVGGVAPVDGDSVVIEAGHTVELDGHFTWGDGTYHANTAGDGPSTVDVFGTLKASRTTDSSLTLRGTAAIQLSGSINYGTKEDPIPAGVKAEIIGGLGATTNRSVILRQQPDNTPNHFVSWRFNSSHPRVRITELAVEVVEGDSSLEVVDATGWEVGDTLLLTSTHHNNINLQHEYVEVASVSDNTVTLVAPTLYAHALHSPVGNMTSNIVIRKHPSTTVEVRGHTNMPLPAPSGGHPEGCVIEYNGVEFDRVWSQNTNGSFLSPVRVNGYTLYRVELVNSSIRTSDDPNNHASCLMTYSTDARPLQITNSIIEARDIGNQHSGSNAIIRDSLILFRGVGISNTLRIYNSQLISNQGNRMLASDVDAEYYDTKVWGIHIDFGSFGKFIRCDIGHSFPLQSRFGDNNLLRISSYSYSTRQLEFNECLFGGSWGAPFSSNSERFSKLSDFAYTHYNALQTDPDQYNHYIPSGLIAKDITAVTNSNASIRLTPFRVGMHSTQYSQRLASDEVVDLIYYFKSDKLPTSSSIEIGVRRGPITTYTEVVPITEASDWYRYDLTLDNTGNSAADYEVTISLVTESETSGSLLTAGAVIAPFIDRHRHYGYRLLDTILGVQVNPLIESDETTASGYTGVDLSGGKIEFDSGNITSWQHVYDYLNYWLVQNINTSVFMTLVGGLINSAWVVVDPPELDKLFGFSESTIELSYSSELTFASCTLIFTEAGNYSLPNVSGATILQNTSGSPVEVELPLGIPYVIDGADITVIEPVLTASITINGLPSGTRVQLYDTSTGDELVNGIDTTTWSEPYTQDRNIRLRAMWVDGTQAIQLIDQQIGEITESNSTITTLIAPVPDNVYSTNNIDGSLVTGVTIDDSALLVEVSTGTLSWAELYAYETYWLYTEEGIRDEQRFATAIDPVNYVWHNFKLKNVTSPVIPITITGGYGRDAGTGTSIALLDTTGGPIFMAPDIVVPYAAGAEATVGIVQAGLTAQGLTPTRVTDIAKESSVQTNIALTVSK